MPDFIPFQVMRKYPHMGPEDSAIWTRFILSDQTAYDAVAYDVKVGSPPAFDTTVNQETGGSALGLYKKKIDVIGLKEGSYTIIEVKPQIDSRALGQVEGYYELVLRDIPEIRNPSMRVIGEALLPDVSYLAEKKGIGLIVV